MTTYDVKSRTTGPITVLTVDAETREDAITQDHGRAARRGRSKEVMQVTEWRRAEADTADQKSDEAGLERHRQKRGGDP